MENLPVSYDQLARSIHELVAASDQKSSQKQLIHHVFPKLAVYNSVDPSLAPSLLMRVLISNPNSHLSSINFFWILSDKVCFETIMCILGKSDTTKRTEERAGGWIQLTRENLKLPEAPSVSSKEFSSKDALPPKKSDKSSK